MAVALARLGVVACVVQYSLYPDALVPQLVEEVAEAFNWVMEHVHEHGGDVNKVMLAGCVVCCVYRRGVHSVAHSKLLYYTSIHMMPSI